MRQSRLTKYIDFKRFPDRETFFVLTYTAKKCIITVEKEVLGMICKKCNTNLPDEAMFCNVCGEKILPEDNIKDETEGELPTKKDKSKKKRIVWLSIIGVLLVLVILGLIFWRSLFFMIAPEEYTAKLISDTVTTLLDEAEKAEKNVLGFDMTMEKDFTVDASVETGKTDEKNEFYVTVSNDTKNKQLLAEGKWVSGEDTYASKMFLDDAYAGATMPWEDGEYLVVPSKNAGQKILDSYGAVGLAAKLLLSNERKEKLKTLDLSYSHIQGAPSKDEKSNEKLKDTLTEDVLGLLEKCEIDGRDGVEYKFDGKTVDAQKIAVKIKPDDLIESCIAFSDALEEDEKMKACLDGTTLGLLETVTELAKNTKTVDEIKSITAELIEYDGKIVQITWKAKKNDGNQTKIAVSFTDSEHLLNGVKVAVENTEAGKYDKKEIAFKSNWVQEDRKISMQVQISSIGEENTRKEMRAMLDFDAEKWSLETKNVFGAVKNIGGKCAKGDKNGFVLEMPAESAEDKIGFSLNLKPSVVLKSDRTEAAYENILEWDKEDIQSFLFGIALLVI